MEKITFKTNINCSACVAKVTSALDANPQIAKWEVNTTNPEKTLTIEGEDLNVMKIIQSLEQVGYKAEKV